MSRVIQTDRLILSPVVEGDYADLCALLADPGFFRHIFPQALNAEEAWFRLLRDIGHWQVMGYGNWSIRTRDDGRYVGSVGLFNYRRILDPAFDAPEIGWGLSPAFQGKGLAFEAATAAVAWAEQQLKARRLVCMISPDNFPSLALAARLGFAAYTDTTYKGEAVILLERLSG
jgi:RimJ/RimL family protein N-acetyltransferase